MMKEIKYALKHKKTNTLLGYYSTSNEGGDFCGDTSYTLCTSGDRTWYADNPIQAEYVRNNSTKWYNAGYETPSHNFKANELAVVKVEITTDMEEIKIKLPSFEEIAKWKGEKYGENDYKFLMYQKKEHPEIQFDLCDIQEYMRNKNG